MAFLRVVEVFPPLFLSARGSRAELAVIKEVEGFVEGVRRVKSSGDLFLVANVKNPRMLKISTVEAARVLQDRVHVSSAPVVVVRDMNRIEFMSEALTAVSLELNSIMVAWGDNYPGSASSTNVRDFRTLSEAIRAVSEIRRRSRSSVRILAPVDLTKLSEEGGAALARGRLKAGADFLLAQPPTTDSGATLERHLSILESCGLSSKVLLNVFPFRDAKDVRRCERYFGWRLPPELHKAAKQGESALIGMEQGVVRSIIGAGVPGVYLSTRGTPEIARQLLP